MVIMNLLNSITISSVYRGCIEYIRAVIPVKKVKKKNNSPVLMGP